MSEKGSEWWRYNSLPSGAPYDWSPAARGNRPDDQTDFHLDLGCGRLKKGRLGIDRFPDEGVDLVMDLENLFVPLDLNDPEKMQGMPIFQGRMPFPDESIESIVTHHCLEHIGPGLVRLMDECHRILVPGGKFRIVVPIFPSYSAVSDPDHKRYFCEGSFETFCGDTEGNHWMESFSTPYTRSRFKQTDEDITKRTNPLEMFEKSDVREMRVTLQKHERSEG